MQFLARLTNIFSNETGITRRLFHSPPRDALEELVNDLRREMYGMDRQEEAVVKRLIANSGQRVTICRSTVAVAKKGKPCYLKEGSQVKIAKIPFQIDADRGVQVVVVDQYGNYMSLKLSDYIRDICADR